MEIKEAMEQEKIYTFESRVIDVGRIAFAI